MGFAPGILGLVSSVTSLVGTGISAYSSYQSGKAQNDMAKYNASLSERNAADEKVASAENARREREMSRRRISSIRAGMAGSGVNLSSGSYLDAIGQTATELELKTMDAINESRRRQDAYLNDAAMQRWQGKQAKTAGTIGAIGTLFGGLANSANNIYSMRYSGVTGNNGFSAPRAIDISTGQPYRY